MTTSMDDVCWRTLSALSADLEARRLSSREIVGECLGRIDALDARLHAFVEVYRDEALAAADAADRERGAGRSRGPLHGLPIAVKDLVHIRGRRTSAGSRTRPHGVAAETATAWERLQDAGMIALGKTHLVEFAFGGWGRNVPMGAPWNPWDLRTHRVAGGSSSGSAVAVAAGLAPAALGTDTGGSIRIPSALCGLTGLKPTHGLVSLAGVYPLALTLDSLGPLARSAHDAGLLLQAMAGADARDPTTARAPAPDFAAALSTGPSLSGVRITALAVDQFPWPAEAAVIRARDAAIEALRGLGAQVEEARVPIDFEDVMVKSGRIIAAEAWARHGSYIEGAADDFDPWVRKRIVAGKAIDATERAGLLKAHAQASAAYASWMRERGALLTPTLPITATALDEVDEATTPLAAFTRAANYLTACALSLPAGFDAKGLPIGVQLMGAPYADATLVRIGRAFQHTTDWHLRHPVL
jgi:aspartyl-tRNA(Asn)/glutamyl-tRNA(Gln) amidotransferase subunit A